jgi:soluble lytic murein transglycosylase-like protein
MKWTVKLSNQLCSEEQTHQKCHLTYETLKLSDQVADNLNMTQQLSNQKRAFSSTWLEKAAAGWQDKLKNVALVGLLGAGLAGLPSTTDAAPKKHQPAVKKVAPKPPPQKIKQSPATNQPPATSQPTSQPAANSAVVIEQWVPKIIQQESRGNPKAVSHAGARGLMQIMPRTWAEMTKKLYGKPLPFKRAFEPELNKKVGIYYYKWIQNTLRDKMKKEPTIEQILAAYNGGIGNLSKANYDIQRMPAESIDYVAKITK